MKFKNKSFSFRLSVSIISIVILIISILFAANYYISKNLLLKNIKESTKNLTYANVQKLEKMLKNVEKIPQNINISLDSLRISEKNLHSLIKRTVAVNDEIVGSGVFFEPNKYWRDSTRFAPYYYKSANTIVYENLARVDYNYFLAGWYQLPIESNKSIWSEPYFDAGGANQLMTTYSLPIELSSIQGSRPVGVITVDVSLKKLQDEIAAIKVFESGFAFLISKSGRIIAHRDSSFVLDKTIFSIAAEEKNEDLKEMGRKMISGASEFSALNSKFVREKSWLFYAPIESSNWSLAIVIPESELFADLRKLHLTLIVLGCSGLFFLFLFIIYTSRSFALPLKTLIDVAGEIASGNIRSAIEILNKSGENVLKRSGNSEQSENEIFRLLSSMDIMADNLDKLVRLLLVAVDRIINAVQTVNDTVSELKSSIQIQTTSTTEVNFAAKEISDSVNVLSECMDNVSSEFGKTGDRLQDGKNSILEIETLADFLLQSLKRITEKLKIISTKTSKINKVLTTISTVADHTNLISLNASIEAEKAGEFGTGFAVIAKEIRRLSDNTSNYAKDIERIVTEVQSAVTDGAKAVDEYNEITFKSLSKINLISKELSGIIIGSENILPEFLNVDSGVKLQSVYAKKISDSMGQLNVTAFTTQEKLNLLLKVASELNDSLLLLQKEISNFK